VRSNTSCFKLLFLHVQVPDKDASLSLISAFYALCCSCRANGGNWNLIVFLATELRLVPCIGFWEISNIWTTEQFREIEQVGTDRKTGILGWNPSTLSLSSVGTFSSWPSGSHWCFRMGPARSGSLGSGSVRLLIFQLLFRSGSHWCFKVAVQREIRERKRNELSKFYQTCLILLACCSCMASHNLGLLFTVPNSNKRTNLVSQSQVSRLC
jgi:hypothetical protein